MPLRNSGVRVLNNYTELEPGGARFIRCRAHEEDIAGVPAGTYTITADWTVSSSGLPFRELQGTITPLRRESSGIMEVELRDVRTASDELDRLYHFAEHALGEGDFDRAAAFASEVLKRDPAGVAALATRARAHAGRGACRLAAEDWERAAIAIEKNEDMGSRFTQPRNVDDQPLDAARWRAWVRTLGSH